MAKAPAPSRDPEKGSLKLKDGRAEGQKDAVLTAVTCCTNLGLPPSRLVCSSEGKQTSILIKPMLFLVIVISI